MLPNYLAKCKIPLCPACVFGKMTKQRWRSGTRAYNSITPDNVKVGEMVSVDQLVSNVQGLIAQMKGVPTQKRYTAATVFVDHKSDYTYVHLQQSTSSKETLEAKHAFERKAASFGINIKRYHSDNGRFADNAWMIDSLKSNQRTTMRGVNAHHQNGKVERRVRQLQDMSRTSLLHACTLWKNAINVHLWPYALRKACDDINHIPHHDSNDSPLELSAQVPVHNNFHHNHTIGCPVFVL
jgi:hypothetical protein